MRVGPHRLRDRVPDRDGRGGVGHDELAAVPDRALHGAPRLPAPRTQARRARHEERAPELQPGHAPRHQRHPLVLRALPLPGQVRAERDAAAGGAERAVRHRALGHPPALLHDGARLHARPEGPLLLQVLLVLAAALLRPVSAAPAARVRAGRLRNHDPLAPDLDISATLRRVHRLPDQSPGDLPAGLRRSHSICPTYREHQVSLQREEEADNSCQGTIWLSTDTHRHYHPKEKIPHSVISSLPPSPAACFMLQF